MFLTYFSKVIGEKSLGGWLDPPPLGKERVNGLLPIIICAKFQINLVISTLFSRVRDKKPSLSEPLLSKRKNAIGIGVKDFGYCQSLVTHLTNKKMNPLSEKVSRTTLFCFVLFSRSLLYPREQDNKIL